MGNCSKNKNPTRNSRRIWSTTKVFNFTIYNAIIILSTEFFIRDREERMSRRRTNARGVFTAKIDATDMFEPNQYLDSDDE